MHVWGSTGLHEGCTGLGGLQGCVLRGDTGAESSKRADAWGRLPTSANTRNTAGDVHPHADGGKSSPERTRLCVSLCAGMRSPSMCQSSEDPAHHLGQHPCHGPKEGTSPRGTEELPQGPREPKTGAAASGLQVDSAHPESPGEPLRGSLQKERPPQALQLPWHRGAWHFSLPELAWALKKLSLRRTLEAQPRRTKVTQGSHSHLAWVLGKGHPERGDQVSRVPRAQPLPATLAAEG